MKKKITIAIDAMGGDNSPDKTIHGLKLFLDLNLKEDDFIINLFGDKEITGNVKGYSGKGEGLNNGEKENVAFVVMISYAVS